MTEEPQTSVPPVSFQLIKSRAMPHNSKKNPSRTMDDSKFRLVI
jgi:hypothetical protein